MIWQATAPHSSTTSRFGGMGSRTLSTHIVAQHIVVLLTPSRAAQGRLPFDAILADLAPADLLCEGSTVTVDGLVDGEMTGLNCCRGTILGKRRDDTFAVRVVKRPAAPLLLSEAACAPAEEPACEAAVDVVLDQTNLLLDVEPSVARHLSTSAKYAPPYAAPRQCSPVPLTSAPANAGPSLRRPSPSTRASSAVSPRSGPAWSPPSHASSACRTCRFGSSLSRCAVQARPSATCETGAP